MEERLARLLVPTLDELRAQLREEKTPEKPVTTEWLRERFEATGGADDTEADPVPKSVFDSFVETCSMCSKNMSIGEIYFCSRCKRYTCEECYGDGTRCCLGIELEHD